MFFMFQAGFLSGKAESDDIIASSGVEVKYGAFAGCPDYITKTGAPIESPACEVIAKAVKIISFENAIMVS